MASSTAKQRINKLSSLKAVTHTRQSTEHSIFGFPSKLPSKVLPTSLDVARHFLFLKSRPNCSNNDIYKIVAEEIIKLWNMASIPTIQYQSVLKRVAQLIDYAAKLCRSKSSSNLHKKYVNSLTHLFDIAACSCPITNESENMEAGIVCTCSREKKIPKQELEFLHDQRSTRKMFIAGVDVAATNVLKRRQRRKLAEELRMKKQKRIKESKCDNLADVSVNDSELESKESSPGDESEQEVSESYSSSETVNQMRMPLSNLAKEQTDLEYLTVLLLHLQQQF